MKTRVHKNLHNGLWAITQRGQVVGYCDSCTLEDWVAVEDAKKAEFSRSGNKRTVHLWAVGRLVAVKNFQSLKGRDVVIAAPEHQPHIDLEPLRYNPAHHSGFTSAWGQVVAGGRLAWFGKEGMFADW